MKNCFLKSINRAPVAEKNSNSKSRKSVDWTALIQLLGILIKFLFKVLKEKKQAQRDRASKE